MSRAICWNAETSPSTSVILDEGTASAALRSPLAIASAARTSASTGRTIRRARASPTPMASSAPSTATPKARTRSPALSRASPARSTPTQKSPVAATSRRRSPQSGSPGSKSAGSSASPGARLSRQARPSLHTATRSAPVISRSTVKPVVSTRRPATAITSWSPQRPVRHRTSAGTVPAGTASCTRTGARSGAGARYRSMSGFRAPSDAGQCPEVRMTPSAASTSRTSRRPGSRRVEAHTQRRAALPSPPSWAAAPRGSRTLSSSRSKRSPSLTRSASSSRAAPVAFAIWSCSSRPETSRR